MKRVGHIACSTAASFALLLAACNSAPPLEWQANAKGALDDAVTAYLVGDTRVANAEFGLARRELASTGRADQVALAELTRCAVQVASLDVGPCAGFEQLRADATAAQRAYADYLSGRVQTSEVALLPEPYRALAARDLSGDGATGALKSIDDPLSRLIATGVLFQGGRANPAAIALAADTASAQGWRRPLLAWLGVQLALAQKTGDQTGAEQLRRRIALVEDTK
ncbi:MAG TPA: hypothetical protein VJ501_01125 [Burkholderiaceae bacterium]|nr:hypothetical protein [Burkholderiaceae bacterium]